MSDESRDPLPPRLPALGKRSGRRRAAGGVRSGSRADAGAQPHCACGAPRRTYDRSRRNCRPRGRGQESTKA